MAWKIRKRVKKRDIKQYILLQKGLNTKQIIIIIIICIVKLRHFCNNRAFLQRLRAFSQHIGHFCRIQKIILSTIWPGCEVGYIAFNSIISWSDEAVQSKSNKDLACYTLFHNNYKTIFIQKQAVLLVNVHFVVIFYM